MWAITSMQDVALKLFGHGFIFLLFLGAVFRFSFCGLIFLSSIDICMASHEFMAQDGPGK